MSEYKRLTKREGKEVKALEWDGEILHRLAELEDKIENGTLIELPCKIGDSEDEYAPLPTDEFCIKNIIKFFENEVEYESNRD